MWKFIYTFDMVGIFFTIIIGLMSLSFVVFCALLASVRKSCSGKTIFFRVIDIILIVLLLVVWFAFLLTKVSVFGLSITASGNDLLLNGGGNTLITFPMLGSLYEIFWSVFGIALLGILTFFVLLSFIMSFTMRRSLKQKDNTAIVKNVEEISIAQPILATTTPSLDSVPFLVEDDDLDINAEVISFEKESYKNEEYVQSIDSENASSNQSLDEIPEKVEGQAESYLFDELDFEPIFKEYTRQEQAKEEKLPTYTDKVEHIVLSENESLQIEKEQTAVTLIAESKTEVVPKIQTIKTSRRVMKNSACAKKNKSDRKSVV